MEISGEHRINASREEVWRALNDPQILMQAIPGCEAMVSRGPDNFEAKVRIAVGPIRARFAGAVTLREIDPPNSYVIVGEGKGGTADFAKGQARVNLVPDGAGTLVKYVVSAQVGGKLAQIGGRMIEGTAKKVAKEFFGKFSDLLAAEANPVLLPATDASATGFVTKTTGAALAVAVLAAGILAAWLWK
ncbi:carbon monoxide dehydrogenase subunit G [Bradyrhizobium sp. LjRoot220]|uniref:CoxG family protein n=1 Tax=Bradyrhizobium sp. LjRoot220 TaxID=3342284 RepID=UPI003ED03B00